MVPSSCMAEHNSVCRLQLAGRSRRRSRSAQRVPRWQTRGALTFCTRSELAGCATPSGRREGSSADAACCTPVRDSSTSPGSSTSCQRARSRSDHGRPAAIILSMLLLIASHEKTEREGAPYKIFIHMLVTLQTVQQTLHTHHATRGTPTNGQRYGLSSCSGYCRARAEHAVSGLPGTSRQNASASAPGPADRWPHAPPAAAGAAERKSLMRRSARRGGGAPAAASGLSLPKGSASMVRQPWGMGRERRRRRARQVSCTEALGAWMAGRERDGPRVRDAATHVESGREEVESRDPHRGIEPRCLAEAGGK